MVQYLPDDGGVFDTSNDVHGRTNAVGAGCAGTATFAAPPQARQVSQFDGRIPCSRTAFVNAE